MVFPSLQILRGVPRGAWHKRDNNKAHEWHLAVRTTPPHAWHRRQLDLSRPCWYPWDDPDGHGSGRFRLSCLALDDLCKRFNPSK